MNDMKNLVDSIERLKNTPIEQWTDEDCLLAKKGISEAKEIWKVVAAFISEHFEEMLTLINNMTEKDTNN